MPESINYQSILIISVLAFITPMLINSVKKVKIPYVVGEILVGLIVGKSFLNIVHDDSWIVFLSNLGLAYLMYLSGFEIDFSQFKAKDGKKVNLAGLSTCLVMFLMALVISCGIANLLAGLGIIKNALFFTFLLPATAPGLLVPFFKERNLSDTDFGQTVLIFSLVCEFLCLISITVISSAMTTGLNYRSFLFIVVIAAAGLLYLAAKRFLRRHRYAAENFGGLHMEIRASFAVILTLVAISQAVGAEIVFGSFIAGVIFSVISGRARDDLKDKVDIIGYGFLVPIFFIEIGINVNIREVLTHPQMLLLIPLILLVFYIVKFVPSLLLSKTYGIKKAFSSSFLVSAQLSLMIVGLQIARTLKSVDDLTYAVFVCSIIISCLLFPLLFEKTFSEDGIVHKRLPAVDRVCVRETVLANQSLFDKPLKEVKFPPGCRIFTILRDGEEILPTGETVLRRGDILLLAGIKANETEMLRLVTEDFAPADGR